MSMSNPEEKNDRLTAGDFLVEIWHRRRIVWQSMASILLIACVYLWVSPAMYTATGIVAPAQSSSSTSSATSALSAVLPSLASLGGSSTPSAATPFDEFMQLIYSPRVAADLVKNDPTILTTIFPAEWNKQTKTWHPSYSPLQIAKRLFSTAFGLDAWEPPSAQRLADYLTTHIQVSAVGTSMSMQQITYTFQDPKFARSFLERVLEDADADIRGEALDRSDKQIAYLRDKLRVTQELDYRATLLALLSQQEMTRMTINKGLPFAASRVQPAFVSDLPTAPNPPLIIALALFVGFFAGVFVALVLTVWTPEFEPKSIPHYVRSLWARVRPGHTVISDHARYGS